MINMNSILDVTMAMYCLLKTWTGKLDENII